VPQGSVLGPILFIIYINDLTETMTNTCKLYADGTKILSTQTARHDSETLQRDIDNATLWCKQWLMAMNPHKCKIMHIGKSNEQRSYTMATDTTRLQLTKTNSERHLGIIISSDLKWHDHTSHAANKANRMLGMMSRTFSHFTHELLKIVYSTFVRPHLEFAIAACNPYSQGDINKLEKVQLRATRLPPAIRNLDYSQRLHVLGLTPLHTRRICGDLIQTYKLVNGLESVTWSTACFFRQNRMAT
jgi:ribonuclease P/MRP protein subunit RPP40